MAAVRGHPFIVRLAFAFHTRDRAFLVSEFMAGGDLFTLMRCVFLPGLALPCLALVACPTSVLSSTPPPQSIPPPPTTPPTTTGGRAACRTRPPGCTPRRWPWRCSTCTTTASSSATSSPRYEGEGLVCFVVAVLWLWIWGLVCGVCGGFGVGERKEGGAGVSLAALVLL